MITKPPHQFISLCGTAMQRMHMTQKQAWYDHQGTTGQWYYHRVNGCWSIRRWKKKNGILYAETGHEHLNGQPLIPITRKKYIKDEGLPAKKLFD